MFNLRGLTAVVTGASSGIGRAMATSLAEAGADISTLYLTEDDIQFTEESVLSTGRRFLAVQGDVSDYDTVAEFAAQTNRELGGPHIWINNAGRLLVKPISDTTPFDWHELLGSNLHGYFYGCREAVRYMLPQHWGRIINVTSITEYQPISNACAYVAGKGGVLGLTRSLAIELARDGITANAIAPGAVNSRLNSDVYTADVRKTYNSRIPVGRIGEPKDVGPAAVFLAAKESGYVTGQQIAVDGGLSINGDVGLPEKS